MNFKPLPPFPRNPISSFRSGGGGRGAAKTHPTAQFFRKMPVFRSQLPNMDTSNSIRMEDSSILFKNILHYIARQILQLIPGCQKLLPAVISLTVLQFSAIVSAAEKMEVIFISDTCKSEFSWPTEKGASNDLRQVCWRSIQKQRREFAKKNNVELTLVRDHWHLLPTVKSFKGASGDTRFRMHQAKLAAVYSYTVK